MGNGEKTARKQYYEQTIHYFKALKKVMLVQHISVKEYDVCFISRNILTRYAKYNICAEILLRFYLVYKLKYRTVKLFKIINLIIPAQRKFGSPAR
jgi:hypothetical protein